MPAGTFGRYSDLADAGGGDCEVALTAKRWLPAPAPVTGRALMRGETGAVGFVAVGGIVRDSRRTDR